MTEIADSYDQFSSFYERMYPSVDYAINEAKTTVGPILQERHPNGRILEIGCGTGFVGLGLVEMGFEYTGVDISLESLKRARREFKARSLKGAFHNQSVTDLHVKRPFDAVVAIASVFTYLTDPDDQTKAIRKMTEHLKPGGSILIGVSNYEPMLIGEPDDAVMLPSVIEHENGQTIILRRRKWFGKPRQRVFRSLDTYICDDDAPVVLDEMRYAITHSEITRMLIDAGFEDVDWMSSTKTGYYQPLCVARKRDQNGSSVDAASKKSAKRLIAHRVSCGNKPNRGDRRSLVLWNGTIDSTYGLMRLLQETDDVVNIHTISVGGLSDRPSEASVRHAYQDLAVRSLAPLIKNRFRDCTWSRSAIDLSPFSPLSRDTVSPMYLLAQAAMTHELIPSDRIFLSFSELPGRAWNECYSALEQEARNMLKIIWRSEEVPRLVLWPPRSDQKLSEMLQYLPGDIATSSAFCRSPELINNQVVGCGNCAPCTAIKDGQEQRAHG